MTGEVRAAVIVVERSGRVTVLNEPGPSVGPRDWDAYEQAVAARLASSPLVCTGSVPPGAPDDAYARLVARARSASVPVLVDASGSILNEALAARPDFVSPSLSEAEGVLYGRAGQAVEDGAPDAGERALGAAEELVRRGAGVALVTAGAAGVALGHAGRPGRAHRARGAGPASWWPAPVVEAVNPIGAGDAFVAGFVGALERGEPLEEAVTAGMCAGAASVETPLPARLEARRALELAARLID